MSSFNGMYACIRPGSKTPAALMEYTWLRQTSGCGPESGQAFSRHPKTHPVSAGSPPWNCVISSGPPGRPPSQSMTPVPGPMGRKQSAPSPGTTIGGMTSFSRSIGIVTGASPVLKLRLPNSSRMCPPGPMVAGTRPAAAVMLGTLVTGSILKRWVRRLFVSGTGGRGALAMSSGTSFMSAAACQASFRLFGSL